MATTVIIDYGVGNIGSIVKMCSLAGLSTEISGDWKTIRKAKRIILPGVGNFGHAMRALEALDLVEPLEETLRDKSVVALGICLGMQILALGSEESEEPGLGLLNAHVKKIEFPKGRRLPVPHMGWNDLIVTRPNPLLGQARTTSRFYFAHSYELVPNDPLLRIGLSTYGHDICVAVQNENIFGVQFHPEKSHQYGLEMFRAFRAI